MYEKVPRWVASGLACLWLSGLALAGFAAAVPEEVTKSKASYTQKLQDFKAEVDAVKEKLLSSYREKLDTLRQAAKQKGELEALQAVDAETKRFEKQKSLPPVTLVLTDVDLAKTVKGYRDAMEKAEVDGARKVSDTTERYLKMLDENKRQAVRDDKLDLAKAFDTEWKAARETPDYQAAKFLIADKAHPEATAAPAEPNKAPVAAVTSLPPPVLAQPRIGPNGEKIQPRVDPDGLYDAARIVEGNPPSSFGSPSTYKQLTTSETGKAPLSGCVGVSMDGYLDAENAKYQLRLKLRPKVANTNFFNLKILVQYFVKNPNGGTIQESRMQFALIPVLGAKNVTCEMKVADLPFGYTYQYRGGNFTETRDGAFLGVVVSVFSPEDKLQGQVTSASVLKDRGRTTFELPAAWFDHFFDGNVLPPDGTFRIHHRGGQPVGN